MNIVLLEKSEIDAGVLPLGDVRARHIIDVLGKGPGDSFDAGLMDGAAGIAHITGIHGSLCFTFEAKSDGKPLYPLEMIVGFPRPIQLKRLFRDMAGLGVRALHLCGTDLGEKSYLDSKIVERGSARRLLEEGTAQAKSTHVPRLTIEASLDACLQRIHRDTCSCEGAMPLQQIAADMRQGGALSQVLGAVGGSPLHTLSPTTALTQFLAEQTQKQEVAIPVLCAIGAERGWTDRERELLRAHGFTLCSMGTRVFRTETACTVAATLILGAMGVLD